MAWLWGNHAECHTCQTIWDIPEVVARKFQEKKLMIAAGTFCFVVYLFRNFGHLIPH